LLNFSYSTLTAQEKFAIVIGIDPDTDTVKVTKGTPGYYQVKAQYSNNSKKVITNETELKLSYPAKMIKISNGIIEGLEEGVFNINFSYRDFNTQMVVIVKSETKAIGMANFSYDDTHFTKYGNRISFFDKSLGKPDSILWYFEGGTPQISKAQNPIVKYTNNGCYTVKLIAYYGSNYDEELLTKGIKITQIISIQSNDDKDKVIGTANFSYDVTHSEKYGTRINYFDKSLGKPDSLKWYFEGGLPQESTDKNPSINYSKNGSYTVKLIAYYGSITQSKVLIKGIIITDINAIEESPDKTVVLGSANFSFDFTHFEKYSTSINFFDKSLGKPDSLKWYFEGGLPQESTDKNPSINYSKNGSYTVKLIAYYGSITQSKVLIKGIIITDINAIEESPDKTFVLRSANFSYDVAHFEKYGTRISFFDKSLGKPDSILWYFEGGTPQISKAQNPIVKYTNNGCYTVKLIAYYGDASDTKILYKGIKITQLNAIEILPEKELLIQETPKTIYIIPSNKSSIKILPYPNPTRDVIHFEQYKGDTYTLYDQNGKPLISNLTDLSPGLKTIDLSYYLSGVYYLRIQSSKGKSETTKITNKHLHNNPFPIY
jgi:PKD repeat protein